MKKSKTKKNKKTQFKKKYLPEILYGRICKNKVMMRD